MRCFPLIVLVFSMIHSAGCKSTSQEMNHPENFPPQIPRTAVLVEKGTGRRVFQAANPGRVYVYDADLARVVFTAHIEPGERLYLEPNQDRATIDGRVVFAQNLERKHTHRIYFDPRDTAATSQPVRFDR